MTATQRKFGIGLACSVLTLLAVLSATPGDPAVSEVGAEGRIAVSHGNGFTALALAWGR